MTSHFQQLAFSLDCDDRSLSAACSFTSCTDKSLSIACSFIGQVTFGHGKMFSCNMIFSLNFESMSYHHQCSENEKILLLTDMFLNLAESLIWTKSNPAKTIIVQSTVCFLKYSAKSNITFDHFSQFLLAQRMSARIIISKTKFLEFIVEGISPK